MSSEPRMPSLGEWACLGAVCHTPSHGWAVAARLARGGDLGRIWHLTRPLTYRSLDLLAQRNWVAAIASEPGQGGPNRTILDATDVGRAEFHRWVTTPVEHLRDVRSELLLKLVLADELGIDRTRLLLNQADVFERVGSSYAIATQTDPTDIVANWRHHYAIAANSFLASLVLAELERQTDTNR